MGCRTIEIATTDDLVIGYPYKVDWTDNCGTPAGWIDLEDGAYSAEIPHITSYGTLINKSDESIVLAQSYNEGSEAIRKQAMGIIVISTACIQSISSI